MIGTLAKGLTGGARMAGDLMKRGFQSSPNASVGIGDVASRLGFDAMFGVMAGASTPGSITDKAIAGTLTTLGGGLGGAALSGALPGAARFGMMRPMTEMAGSFIGDAASMSATDSILRMKSPDGMTTRERQMQEADAAYRMQVEQEILRKLNVGG